MVVGLHPEKSPLCSLLAHHPGKRREMDGAEGWGVRCGTEGLAQPTPQLAAPLAK